MVKPEDHDSRRVKNRQSSVVGLRKLERSDLHVRLDDEMTKRVLFRRIVPILLSLLVTGLGQISLGKYGRGLVFVCLALANLLGLTEFGLLRSYAGLLAYSSGQLALGAIAAIDAYRQAKALEAAPSHHPPKLVLRVATTIAVVVGFLGLAFLLVRLSPTRIFRMRSSSLAPTIRQGERFVIDFRYFRSHSPRRGEVVAFQWDKDLQLKRIIAAPGDTVEGVNNGIFLNGHLLDEAYVVHTKPMVQMKNMRDFGPAKIPQGHFFVMGDNRDGIFDSLFPQHGLVPADNVKGKALYIFGSPDWSRIGTKIDHAEATAIKDDRDDKHASRRPFCSVLSFARVATPRLTFCQDL